jgi:hypothetical protein
MKELIETHVEKLILYTAKVSGSIYNCALSNTTLHEFLSKDAFDGFIAGFHASGSKEVTISDITQSRLSHAFCTEPPAMRSHTKFHTAGTVSLGRHYSERLDDDLLCYTLPTHKELALQHIAEINAEYLSKK